MIFRLAQSDRVMKSGGFTLVEVLISFVIFAASVGGLIYGYGQANRMATWSSWSVAAQSYAQQGAEQARSAQWNSQMWPVTSGPGTGDELGCPANYFQVDTLDVPSDGSYIYITNFVSITQISTNPSVRQIRSDCVWWFPLTGQWCTNTAITLRAPD